VVKQMTEMLKGTLEGIVLAILSVRPAYGYEITARLREQGFSDIVEGTVYALLVRIEQRGFVDVEKKRAAADGTSVREIVGDDPVEFAETFAQAYTGTKWIDKERARLTKAIEDAERGQLK
jgi:Transcriptional regulator PadR-like family